MRSRPNLFNVLLVGLTLLYPLAVYFGLQVVSPRLLGLALALLLAARHGRSLVQFTAKIELFEWGLAALLAALVAGVILLNSERLLLLYPAAVSFGLLLIFGRSLLVGQPVIERIARLSEPDLPPEGVRYTRRVTLVWCGFFVFNGAIAFASVFAPRSWWLLYNGCIAYVLMGLLFAAEYAVRRRVRRRNGGKGEEHVLP